MFHICNNRFIYCISVSIISIELPSNSVVRIYFGIRLNPLCVCMTLWAGLPSRHSKIFWKNVWSKVLCIHPNTNFWTFKNGKWIRYYTQFLHTKKFFFNDFCLKKPNFFIVLAHSASLLLMMMVFGKRITTYTLPQVELMHVKTFDLFLRNKNC